MKKKNEPRLCLNIYYYKHKQENYKEIILIVDVACLRRCDSSADFTNQKRRQILYITWCKTRFTDVIQLNRFLLTERKKKKLLRSCI